MNDARRLRALDEETRPRKRIIADQALNRQVVKDLPGKKVGTPEQQRTAVIVARETAGIIERRRAVSPGLRGRVSGTGRVARPIRRCAPGCMSWRRRSRSGAIGS